MRSDTFFFSGKGGRKKGSDSGEGGKEILGFEFFSSRKVAKDKSWLLEFRAWSRGKKNFPDLSYLTKLEASIGS